MSSSFPVRRVASVIDSPFTQFNLDVFVMAEIIALRSQRTALTQRAARLADRASMLDEIQVRLIILGRRDYCFKIEMRLFASDLRTDQAQALRDAMHVRIDG